MVCEATPTAFKEGGSCVRNIEAIQKAVLGHACSEEAGLFRKARNEISFFLILNCFERLCDHFPHTNWHLQSRSEGCSVLQRHSMYNET